MGKNLSNLLQSDNIKYLLIIISVIYVLILQHIDRDLLEYVNSLGFRIVYVIIVIYVSQISPSIALILFALFMFTLHELNCKNSNEDFSNMFNLFNLSKKKEDKKLSTPKPVENNKFKQVMSVNKKDKHSLNEEHEEHKEHEEREEHSPSEIHDVNDIHNIDDMDMDMGMNMDVNIYNEGNMYNDGNENVDDEISRPVEITLDNKAMFNTIVPVDDSCIPVDNPKSIEDVKGFCPDINY